jgi:chromosome segregation ATPase
VLETKDNLIEDLKKEVDYMKRQIEDTKEYTDENHDDIAKIKKDSAKLKIRIEE